VVTAWLVIAWTVQTAAADRYPLEITDRPLALPAGATVFDIAMSFISFVLETDEMGNAIAKDRLYRRRGSLGLSHAFGNVEVGASLGTHDAGASIRIATRSIPAVVDLSAWISPEQPDGRDARGQHMGIAHNVVVAPGRFAIFSSAGVSLVEARIFIAPDTLGDVHVVDIGARVVAEVQLARRLGVYASVGTSVPVAHSSSYDVKATIGTGATLLFALRRWDFWTSCSLGLERDPPTSLSFGITKRWGI
jgi:hypothetical protein